ncbi:hypothetical protein Poli38472_001657 [Pythium oligandrum]|uniref:EF-hand domain-containing protein n=1 Tax=Pythium oligandrum TaxID=41045 RepID=A0A8K1CTD2_PYTOL|nr:hypothetical protein Poli38472_001657 [Pythium oligandrum]|eukprot:TMW69501.1 hypothetical protein Poli38472_001657 [Pythium oligandrum]
MESSRGFDLPPVLKPDVEKRVLHVFTYLRQHERKARLARKIAELQGLGNGDEKQNEAEHLAPAVEVLVEELEDVKEERKETVYAQLEPSLDSIRAAVQAEIEELQKTINFRDFESTGLITATDLHSALRALNHTVSKADVQWMIWEVDDDQDGSLDWEEFRGSFVRCIVDRQGLEPNQLFCLILFLLCDTDNSLALSPADVRIELQRIPGTEYLISKLLKAFKVKDEQRKYLFTQFVSLVLNDLPTVPIGSSHVLTKYEGKS